MVTTHKISTELYDDSFQLIAMHCGLESYAIAYHLNSYIKLKLNRKEEKKEDEIYKVGWLESFPIYEWKDELKDQYWTLIANTVTQENKNDSYGLFSNEILINKMHLVKERKEVDYFLKIETEDATLLNEIIKKINLIPKVVTAYSIDVNTLKSKRNLIF